MTAEPGSLKSIREWKEPQFGVMYDWELAQWVKSGKYELFCSNLDMVIERRSRTKPGMRSKIRRAWTACRNDEIYARLAKEGIIIS